MPEFNHLRQSLPRRNQHSGACCGTFGKSTALPQEGSSPSGPTNWTCWNRSRRWVGAGAGAMILLGSQVFASPAEAPAPRVSQDLGAMPPPHLSPLDVRSVQEALDRNQPHAVLASLREAVAQRPAPSASTNPGTSHSLWHLRLRAEVEAGYPDRILPLLEEIPPQERDHTEVFWLAQAFLSLGRVEEAGDLFRPLASERDFPWRWESALGLARALGAQKKWKPALAALAPIPPDSPIYVTAALEKAHFLLASGEPAEAERQLLALDEVSPAFQARQNVLLARARLDLGQPAEALLLLRGNTGPEFSGVIAQEQAVLQAESHHRLGQTTEGVAVLERYLRQAVGRSPRWQAFNALDRLLATQASPSLGELRRLAVDETEPWRAAEATRILSRAEARANRLPAAREALQAMARRSDHPYGAEIQFDLARLEIENGNHAVALDLLAEKTGPQAAFWRGVAWLAGGNPQNLPAAMEAFAKILNDPQASPDWQKAAAFNGALAGLLCHDDPGPFLKRFREFFPDPMTESEMRLVAAIEAARRADPQAGRQLRELVPAMGQQAALPLAEWLLVTGDPVSAREILQSVQAPPEEENSNAPTQTPTPAENEARAFLEIFLADRTPSGSTSAGDLGRQFLRDFPDSVRRPQVRMKLAEIAYRSGDFHGAHEAFTQVANEAASPTMAAQAWFLAGRSATKLMTEQAIDQALLAFEEAAQAGGETAARARFEQALLFNARDQHEQALVLLDRVALDTRDQDLRAAALVEKGDTIFKQAGQNRALLDQAVATWMELVQAPGTSAAWRHQALTKIGLAREQSGQPAEAMEDFYRVLRDGEEPADWFWYERAGFEVGRLLEERRALAEAITVYQQLAAAGGPRAEEAATRANRLRLENFLWEE